MVRKGAITDTNRALGRDLPYSSVGLNEILNSELRLDASFYDLEFRKAKNLLERCKSSLKPLYGDSGFSGDVNYPGRFKRVFVDSGIPIFTASQILDFEPKTDKFISRKTMTEIDTLRLLENQIVMTRSGSIGNIAIVSETLKDKVFSDDVIRINFTNEIDVGYVYAFLKTSIGKQLVGHNTYGSVIKHIEPDHLKSILIPDAPSEVKDHINEKIRKVYALRDQAVSLFATSREQLFTYLGLQNFEEFLVEVNKRGYRRTAFTVKTSKLNDRLDASFHDKIPQFIEKEIERTNCEITNLDDPSVSKKITLPGRFKRIYVSEGNGIPFLSGGDITQFLPSQIKYLSISHHSKRINRELKLDKGSILITCSGTIGNVMLVPSHYEGWTASQHMIRVIPSEIADPGYLFAYLSSEYGRNLIRQWSYGAVVPEVDRRQVSRIKIPLLSEEKQHEIGKTALEASKKWSTAYYLEMSAINELEDMIKRGDI